MTDQFGLKKEVIEKIQTALAGFAVISVAVLYGSRAKGNFKPGSDIDLTLKTVGNRPDHLLMNVMMALDDLELPYTFDVSLFEHIDNDDLIEHIDRVGIEFYNAKTIALKQK